MSNLMFIGEIKGIYVKPTNDDGGWSYAARPEVEDSKFYELNGEWFYVVKDRAELISLRDQGSWLTSTDPNQLVSITDKDSITKSIPMNNLVTTRINNMSSMFRGEFSNRSQFNQYIGNWDTGNVTSMERMFDHNSAFNQPIENWDTGNLTTMRGMFHQSSFNKPIGNWDTGNVTDMGAIFAYQSSFNKPIGNWDTGNVTNMQEMFRNNVVFNQDLSSWCVSSVTNHINFNANTPSWTLPKPNFTNPPC